MVEFLGMVLTEATDAELAGRVGVEPGAEEELCRRLGRRIFLYGLRHLRDEAGAADLVQEVLLITLAGLREGKLREPEKLGSFVLGTCRLTVWNLRRGGARQAKLLEEYQRTRLATLPPAAPGVDREQLARCLGALPARERSVIVMSFYEERGGEELAGALELSMENIRVIRHRALRRLRGCLEGVQ